MSTYKTKAIILKTQDYKENDKIIWLFTEKIGKISAIAKGAKKNKSKFLSSTLPFCFGEFVIYRGKSMYLINEVQIIHSFGEFLNDLEMLTYASYLNELIDIALLEEESNRELFRQVVTAYYLMKNKVGDVEILVRAFEIKLLSFTGYGLNFQNCCICGKKISSSNYINFSYGGGVCSECNKQNGVTLTNTAYNVLKILSNFPLEKVHRVSVKEDTKKELYKILYGFILENYQKAPKSLNMLNVFKEESKNE
ncbi:DNA repair protein RecO [Haloimpatiens massiliensis]|uniref:DNA repair protein RecO n=1 Tax=Haloimpatiens massiliensis TaxID=1658110 RepID=UPI000C828A21